MTYTFEVRTESTLGVEELFDRAHSVEMHLESMSGSDEQVVDPVDGDLLGLGQTVTWRARHFGVWWTMSSRITEMDAPASFTDEQVKGPFKTFRHVHTFERSGELTVMTDRIKLTAPFGLIGSATERLLLGPYLRRMIERRGVVLARPAR